MGFLRGWWQRLRLGGAFPERWQGIIERNVPLLSSLDPETRARLLGLVRQFLREKRFEGANDLEITDEIRLTIAAQACLLHLGLEGPLYPTLRTIIVYPDAYVADDTDRQPGGVEVERREVRSGESWGHGTLVLSWRDVQAGAADPGDGLNVVFHEFAHKLDEETGESNGAPALPNADHYQRWQRVFSRAYEQVQRAIEFGGSIGPYNPYAGESPAEFFAVSTELFFERPGVLRAHNPDLYNELRGFYHQPSQPSG